MQHKKYCAVVDAYSSGALMYDYLSGYGYSCIHVQSAESVLEIYQSSMDIDRYETNIVFQGDLDMLLNELRKFPLEFIITGSEPGVELTDILNNILGLPGNEIGLSKARRNKYLMIEALKKNNLLTTDQICSGEINAILEWTNNKWPVVLKPISSAGSDGVSFCDNKTKLLKAFNTLIGKENKFGIINEQLLVQRFIEGDEYVVNTVSYSGCHYISEIWEIKKIIEQGGGYVYDIGNLLENEGSRQALLSGYVVEVLNSLGIKYGAAHHEVIITKNGPILVEVGARPAGALSKSTVIKSLEYNHVSLCVESYVDPVRFQSRLNTNYVKIKNVSFVCLISNQLGIISDYGNSKKIKSLDSFCSTVGMSTIGDKIEPTVDLFSSPGLIYLVHEDNNIIQDDYNTIRDWESQGFFIVE
jgi:hypothetical protein